MVKNKTFHSDSTKVVFIIFVFIYSYLALVNNNNYCKIEITVDQLC